jgi:hypothetical protein
MPTQKDTQSQIARKVNFAIQLLRETAAVPAEPCLIGRSKSARRGGMQQIKDWLCPQPAEADISGPQGKSEEQPMQSKFAPAEGVTPPAEVLPI